MEMARKPGIIHLELQLWAAQEEAEGFISNLGNADKLVGLWEDIREAILEYQVCMSLGYPALQCLTFEPDFITTKFLWQGSSAPGESPPLRLSFLSSEWRTDISESRSSRHDAPHYWSRVSLWGRKCVPERNEAGCPVAD